MILVFAYDHNDMFVCTMNFKDEYTFNEFLSNVSFDNPLGFEVIDLDEKVDTLQ
jgi:hypothetical protein